MSLKRILPVSAAVAVLAALALAAPAGAAVKGVCTVAGEAKMFPPVQLIREKGTFAFEAYRLDCVGVGKEGPVVVLGAQVEAVGVYKNVVCGTGKAYATVGQLTGVPPELADKVKGDKFAIDFIAGTGQFYWHHDDFDKDTPDFKVMEDLDPLEEFVKPNEAKVWESAGEIQLLPPEHKLNTLTPPDCMKGFSVFGSVLIHALD